VEGTLGTRASRPPVWMRHCRAARRPLVTKNGGPVRNRPVISAGPRLPKETRFRPRSYRQSQLKCRLVVVEPGYPAADHWPVHATQLWKGRESPLLNRTSWVRCGPGSFLITRPPGISSEPDPYVGPVSVEWADEPPDHRSVRQPISGREERFRCLPHLLGAVRAGFIPDDSPAWHIFRARSMCRARFCRVG
jgi:hypothetical protein